MLVVCENEQECIRTSSYKHGIHFFVMLWKAGRQIGEQISRGEVKRNSLRETGKKQKNALRPSEKSHEEPWYYGRIPQLQHTGCSADGRRENLYRLHVAAEARS